MIAGGIAAVLIWIIYFGISGLMSYIKERKAKRSDVIHIEDNVNDNKKLEFESIKQPVKKEYFTKQNFRALLFILIGCISLYYATQCVFYSQFSAFNAIYFGEENTVANELSDQILGVGVQAYGDGKTLIELMQGLFTIIGLICLTYGGTNIKIKK